MTSLHLKGSLYLIGSGPGDLSLLPEMARRAIEVSDIVIGYSLYLDLLRPLLDGKEVFEGVMTKEEERAALAIEKCEQGKIVALISSGDIGIYGLASLVFETLEQRNLALDVWVVPGISALSSAGSLLGAPLNHDFCAISLSDLLTPWPLIERRIEAAAQGDFNIVFYNPKSGKRDWQLAKAAEILLRYRLPETPAGIVSNAYRKEQKVQMLALKDLPSAPVDMLSTVVIGNSTTRTWKNWMFTPRGYLSLRGAQSATKQSRIKPDCFAALAMTDAAMPVPLASNEITQESFRIIEEGLGPHGFAPEELAVAIRVIHATGDFSLASLLRFQNGFFDSIFRALRDGQPIVTDVEMTRSGISKTLLKDFRSEVVCHLSEVSEDEAIQKHATRSAAGIRKAVQLHPQAVYVIGNAPTALLELLSLAASGKAQPAAVIGVPVGFVNVEQSKEALLKTTLPACTVVGRRGGSPVASAVINACLKMAHGAPNEKVLS